MDKELEENLKLIAAKYASDVADGLLSTCKAIYQQAQRDILTQLHQEAQGRSANEIAHAIETRLKELDSQA